MGRVTNQPSRMNFNLHNYQIDDYTENEGPGVV